MATVAERSREEEPCILTVRHMREDEYAFVLDAWKKGYAYSKFAMNRGPRYWDEQDKIARFCMTRGTVLVATTEEAPDAALGWICGRREPATIDYIYVKSDARRLGVATGLFLALAGVPWRQWRPRMTHRTWKRQLKALVEGVGWAFAPVSAVEMGDG
jgi:GNAT superfamily N-acetyltransferase